MSLRLLFGALGPELSDLNNQSALEGADTSEKTIGGNYENIIDFQTPAKFHIGILSLSLIAGLGFGGFIAYKAWMEKNIFLDYVRNLIIALVCRTFFSIIFDGAILLGTPSNVGGGNTLLAFEQICLNLVLAFWLTFTIYLHARVQRNFNSEPTLRLYQYGVPGVAVFFALIWIFTLQDQNPSSIWWIIITPKTQWIVNSVNLLFLLIQLGLVGDMSRMMLKVSLDNDSISLLRSTAVMMAVLILIFWFQFGFTIGRVPLRNATSYVYFYYFIDGLECGLVCLVLFFFNKWVHMLLNIISSLIIGIEEAHTKTSNANTNEVLLHAKGDRGIVTIDSVFMTTESGKWKNSQEERTNDVVYSNVVQPERLKKTFDLYKRLNIIPADRPTVVEGEEFYDCHFQNPFNSNESDKNKLPTNQILSSTSSASKRKVLNEGITLKSEKINEQPLKKNAFYASKYLILDTKDNDIPKYLETRPSVSSVSGKDSLKEERVNKDFSSALDSLMSDELVRKWLIDNSENMQKSKQNKIQNHQETCKSLNEKNLDLERSVQQSQVVINTEDGSQQKENQSIMSESKVSTVTSTASDAFLGISKAGRNNSVKERDVTPIPPDAVRKNPETPEIITAVRNDPEKSLINDKKNLEATESEKKEPVKTNDVKSELNTSKPISLKLKPDPDFKPLENKNDIIDNEEQTENFNSESQKKNFKTFESTPSKPVNPSELENKVATPESSKEEFPAELDETQTSKPKADFESQITDLEENSNKIDKPVTLESLNQCLTYSDLLEFCSENEKQKLDQLSNKGNNLFSFSSTFTSTIGSLINATGSLFFSSSFPDSEKCSKSENLDIVKNNSETNKEEDQQDAKRLEDIPKLQDQNKYNDFSSNHSDFETENVNIRKSQNLESKCEKFGSLEFQSAFNADKTEKTANEDVRNKAEHYLKSNSKTSGDDISVSAGADEGQIETDFASSLAGAENSNEINQQVHPKDSEPLEIQSLNKLISEKSTKTCKITDSSEIPRIELQCSKPDLKKNKSNLKSKSFTKYDAPKPKKQKLYQQFKKPKLSELDLPIKTDKIQKLQPEQSQTKVYGPPVLRPLENEIDVSDKSSDSEFSVEKRKNSNSSCGSFSVDHYYSQLMHIQEKFHNPSNSNNDKKMKTFT